MRRDLAVLVVFIAIGCCGCGGDLPEVRAALITYDSPFRSHKDYSYGSVVRLALVLFASEDLPSRYGKPDLDLTATILDSHGKVHRVDATGATGRLTQGSLVLAPAEIRRRAKPHDREYVSLILKSKQDQSTATGVGGKPVREGDYWVTEGFDFPSFEATDYELDYVSVVERESGRWLKVTIAPR